LNLEERATIVPKVRNMIAALLVVKKLPEDFIGKISIIKI
tara:strand:- start:110 stop:229 length:120 start_codon:yes stop_codon:yes gene_type:complete